MSNFFGPRFYDSRAPAWRNLGVTFDQPVSAQDAWGSITPYDVSLYSTWGVAPGERDFSNPLKAPYNLIVRDPVPDDNVTRVFGVVGPEYTLIPPQEVCQIFDEKVSQPVETLGAFGHGETLFVTTRLEDFAVRGDPVENYLVLESPYDGQSAISARITPVRVRCWNTLLASRRYATETYKIPHFQNAKKNLEVWLSDLMTRVSVKQMTLQEAFDLFALYYPVSFEVEKVLEEVYPTPALVYNAPADVMEKREQDHAWVIKAAQKSRQAVQELFEGAGTGLDDSGIRRSSWALYNAITEWENYRSTTNLKSRAMNVLRGDRSQKMEMAFSSILALTKK